MRSVAAAFGAAPVMPTAMAYNDGVQCGQPIACHIEQPVQTVHVQAMAPVQTVVAVQQLQPVVQPIMQTVQATEMRPIKQTVQRPVVRTEYVDQAVTVMTPVSELRTENVATMNYQTVTEYKTVRKQAGYWVTKNIPCNRVSAYQYDNRPNALGAVNRASYNMRNAFTPNYQQVRTFVPQTMTCTVPCKRQVAVPGMKQVTYNVTKMQPTQTTRKVAVNKVTYETAEVTVMAPHLVTKTVQIGHRISYAPAGTTSLSNQPGNAPGQAPTSSAVKPRPAQTATPNDGLDSSQFNDTNKKTSALEDYVVPDQQLTETTVPARKFTAAAKANVTPTAVRVSQWVARTPAPNHSNPQPGGKSTAISVADSTR
jgi:hypothetical protein